MAKNSKMVTCRNCNATMSANAKICPSCGAKNKKPFYKKWWFILIVIVAVIGIIGSRGGSDKDKSNDIDKTTKYKWPDSVLASLIPQPASECGKVSFDNEKSFWIDVYNISQDQFEEYIEECKNSGFTVEYSRLDSFYTASDENGYSLSLNYDSEEETMSISMNAPNEETEETTPADEETSKSTAESAETESAAAPEESTENEKENHSESVDGMRPEFKEAMDSYEEFFDEYCEFMKTYSESDNAVGMLADYTEYMTKYADAMEKLDEIGEEELNDAELKYYMEVMGRINQKLLEAATK